MSMQAKIVIGVILLLVTASVIWQWGSSNKKNEVVSGVKIESMLTLTSPEFGEGQMIPAKFTCDGANTSPPLTITQIPPGTKSLVLVVDDPDAPLGTWVHWLVWNIDPETATISAGTVPGGAIQGTTSFGKPGYGGPCPPSGTHRYQFKLYALDQKLELVPGARKAELEKAMQAVILDKTILTGLYKRH
jgi:Raf kinase inhibitor-like YbhB/YbcL family protein